MFPKSQFLLKLVIPGTGKRLNLILSLSRRERILTPEESLEKSVILSKKISRLKIEIARLTQIADEKRVDL